MGGKKVTFGYFADEDEAGRAAKFSRREIANGHAVDAIRKMIKEGKHTCNDT